jgi:hypothetical protein
MIISDRRLWRKNFKIGHLPGDMSIQAKILILKLKPERLKDPYKSLYIRRTCKAFKRVVIKKANRRWRHEFKSQSHPHHLKEE